MQNDNEQVGDLDLQGDNLESDRREVLHGVLWGGAPVLGLFLLALLLGVRGFQAEFSGFAQRIGALFFWASIGWSVVGAVAVIALYGRFMSAMATGMMASLAVAWVVMAALLVVGG